MELNNNGNIIDFNSRYPYYFGVYNHKMVIQDSRLIIVKFIVIKIKNNGIVRFTKLHNYISVGKTKASVRVDANAGSKVYYVCCLLNFVFVDHARRYKISNILDITSEHLEDFMYDYSMNHDDDLRYPIESTVNTCVYAVIDFMENYLKKHDFKRSKQNEFHETVTSRNKHNIYTEKKVPSFDVVYNGKPKTIFRDIPNSVFNVISSYAATYYKEIFFMITLSAFTGMRPSEVCNVRQESSPLGKGIYIYRKGNKIEKINIDITEEKQLRSDLVSVGGIKKERWQQVYPKFYAAFMNAYEIHKEYLSKQKYESQFCPMFVDSHGMAMTYGNYYRIFNKMIDEIKPILIESTNPEISTYGHMLLQNNISPHIFRHWFSVRLALYGEDVANLQYWRGDKSPLSAMLYLKNKGELAKQLAYTNNSMFEFMLDAATTENNEE